MPPRTNLYLDVDGVLLRRTLSPAPGLAFEPARHLTRFLAFATTHFAVRWLTSRARHGFSDGIERGFRHALQVASLPPGLRRCFDRIEAARWQTHKTDAIDLSTEFYWIDDSPSEADLLALAAHGRADRWIPASVDTAPDDLLRIERCLRARLEGARPRCHGRGTV